MSDSDGWAERVTGHAAVSADGVVQHKKLHANQPPQLSVSTHSPLDRGLTLPSANGGLGLRGYVGKLQAKARSAGRAIAGVHSPRLKHSLSDDMELGGFALPNGISPRWDGLRERQPGAMAGMACYAPACCSAVAGHPTAVLGRSCSCLLAQALASVKLYRCKQHAAAALLTSCTCCQQTRLSREQNSVGATSFTLQLVGPQHHGYSNSCGCFCGAQPFDAQPPMAVAFSCNLDAVDAGQWQQRS